MDCYFLAKYYNRDPDEFLNKSITSIQRHLHWTSKMIKETQPQEDED